jgi:hypothetical protein
VQMHSFRSSELQVVCFMSAWERVGVHRQGSLITQYDTTGANRKPPRSANRRGAQQQHVGALEVLAVGQQSKEQGEHRSIALG